MYQVWLLGTLGKPESHPGAGLYRKLRRLRLLLVFFFFFIQNLSLLKINPPDKFYRSPDRSSDGPTVYLRREEKNPKTFNTKLCFI